MQNLVRQVCKKNQKKKIFDTSAPYIRFLRPDAQNMYGAGVQLFIFEFLTLFFCPKSPPLRRTKNFPTEAHKTSFFYYYVFPTTAHKTLHTTAHKGSEFTQMWGPHKNVFTTNVCTGLSIKNLRIWAHAFLFFFVRRSGGGAYTSAPYILKKNKKWNPRI